MPITAHPDWRTAAWPTGRCPYCRGRGQVHGHGSVPDRRCLACEGSGQLPVLPCPLCEGPLLDTDTKVWSVAGKRVHPDGAVHLECWDAAPKPFPGCLACGGTGTVPAGWVTINARPCPCLDLTEEDET